MKCSIHSHPHAWRPHSRKFIAFPNCRFAAYRASLASSPSAISSRSFRSLCRRISASNPRAKTSPRTSIPPLRQISLSLLIARPITASRRLNHTRDSLNHAVELRLLDLQLLSARHRQTVVARTPILRGHTPLRFHPTLDQHALKRGIQRSFFHL